MYEEKAHVTRAGGESTKDGERMHEAKNALKNGVDACTDIGVLLQVADLLGLDLPL